MSAQYFQLELCVVLLRGSARREDGSLVRVGIPTRSLLLLAVALDVGGVVVGDESHVGICWRTFSMNCWEATWVPETKSAVTCSFFQRSMKLSS